MTASKWPITWDARWIWAGPAPLPVSPIGAAGIPPKETWNRFCYLRRTVQLDSVPTSVPARVTADSRFVLFVNGVEVARGPARSIPERLAWTEIDLAPYLRAGRNAIAALVRFYGVPGPWWRPAAPSFLLGFGSFALESPTIGSYFRRDVERTRRPVSPGCGARRGAPSAANRNPRWCIDSRRLERCDIRRFRLAPGGRIAGGDSRPESHANPGRAFHFARARRHRAAHLDPDRDERTVAAWCRSTQR